MNQEQIKIAKDLWVDIFEYLDGEDLLTCSLVCKYFYQLNRNNKLWFRKIYEKELYRKKKVSKEHPIVCYYDQLNYKQYYLALFHHSYQFGLFLPYLNLKNDYERFVKHGHWKTKVLFFCIFAPLQALLFPVYGFCEILEYFESKKRKIEYCDCKQCYRKQCLTLLKIKN